MEKMLDPVSTGLVESVESDPKESVSTGGLLKEVPPPWRLPPVETDVESAAANPPGKSALPLDTLLWKLQAARLDLARAEARAADLRERVLDALDHAPGRYDIPGFGDVAVRNQHRQQFDAKRFRAAHADLWRRYSLCVPFTVLRLTPDAPADRRAS
jgi:hypothetical protein